ncbi:MAG: hypothetical protein PWP65_392 [Clostridia bacterium]|nr:hypothetical protein [Clostridia bacterium]
MPNSLNTVLPLPPSRFSRRKKRTGRRTLFSFVLFCLLGWLVTGWAWQAFNWRMLKTERVFTGTITENLVLEGLIFREETILTAPVTGKLEEVAREGEKVPAGAPVVKIFPAATSPEGDKVFVLKAPFAGQICYHPDGLENVLKPDLFDKIPPEEIKRLARLAQPADLKDTVTAGQPVVRVTNNLLPAYFLAEFPVLPEGWQVGKNLSLKWQGQEERFQAELYRLQKAANGWQALFQIEQWGDELFHAREVKAEAIFKIYRGVVVPKEALTRGPDGKTSVYFLSGTRIRIREVEVVGLAGDKAAVKGLEEGTEVVTNPRVARRLAHE